MNIPQLSGGKRHFEGDAPNSKRQRQEVIVSDIAMTELIGQSVMEIDQSFQNPNRVCEKIHRPPGAYCPIAFLPDGCMRDHFN